MQVEPQACSIHLSGLQTIPVVEVENDRKKQHQACDTDGGPDQGARGWTIAGAGS